MSGSGLAAPPDARLDDLVREASKGWSVSSATDRNDPWIKALPAGWVMPVQGWKLHVSAYPSQACETLARVLPVLAAHHVAFKVLGSSAWLAELNRGAAGLSQVGKFITVYPRAPGQAVTLGRALVQATASLRGPVIPSDRPLVADGVVHYRYGAFGSELMQTLLGEIVPALVTPDGDFVPDDRSVPPRFPAWAIDPFEREGLVASAERPVAAPARYRPVVVLADGIDVLVQLGFDTLDPRPCVIKRSKPGGDPEDRSERSARRRLSREADLLRKLGPSGATPRLLDLMDDGETLAIVMEDLGGERLDRHMSRLLAQGRSPSREEIIRIGATLADALAAIHETGHIHGDLKSGNILVGAGGAVRLIDLDLALPIGAARPPGAGTRGYTSPQCRAAVPAAVGDDIYGLGAVLYLLATGAEPSRAPDPADLLRRPPALLNPALSADLVAIIERCLCPIERGFAPVPAASDVAEALRGLQAGPAGQSAPPPRISSSTLLTQARGAADLICAQAEPMGDGVVWRSTYFAGKGMVGRDLNTGMAGTILTLSHLAAAFDDPYHATILRKGAWSLQAMPPFKGARPAGLYVGEMGVAVALLRAGQTLRSQALTQAAIGRSRAAAKLPEASPDVFHGTAGRVLGHLLVWDETQDEVDLEHARRLGERLLALRDGGPGEAFWRIPDGYGGLSGQVQLGYAHGAAGIADVLLELFVATGDPRFRDVAADAVSWLARQALPALNDGSGAGWPATPNGPSHAPFWCHGAAGIARLWLNASRLGIGAASSELLQRAAWAVARGASWAGPTLCHGLAGNAELLLDVGGATGEPKFRLEAERLMTLAASYANDTPGGLGWICDPTTSSLSPDLMVGYGGTALAALRFAVPHHPPPLGRGVVNRTVTN